MMNVRKELSNDEHTPLLPTILRLQNGMLTGQHVQVVWSAEGWSGSKRDQYFRVVDSRKMR